MITFEGNKLTLKRAKLLESKARNTYQHISTHRIRKLIGYDRAADPAFFTNMREKYSSAREMIRQSGDIYTALVVSLREGKMGNCPEDAMMAELIGKLNGQENIYTGNIKLSKDGKAVGALNHVVAFITDRNVQNNKEYFFKNKDAIIIDPWLGITDYVGNYFNKLKSTYRNIFMQEKNPNFATFTNDEFVTELLKAESKTPKEYNSKKKMFCPITSLSIVPFVHNLLNGKALEIIRETFPELVLKNFKEISLSNKQAKIINLNSVV